MVKWSWFIFSHDLVLPNTTNWVRDRAMVFSATFNYISGISWRSALLVNESEIPGENHRHAASH
jgi:hypothetical protein